MPRPTGLSTPRASAPRAIGDSECYARAMATDPDEAVGHAPTKELDSFESALRARPEIVERMEAVIADPSTAVSSRHHTPPEGR